MTRVVSVRSAMPNGTYLAPRQSAASHERGRSLARDKVIRKRCGGVLMASPSLLGKNRLRSAITNDMERERLDPLDTSATMARNGALARGGVVRLGEAGTPRNARRPGGVGANSAVKRRSATACNHLIGPARLRSGPPAALCA